MMRRSLAASAALIALTALVQSRPAWAKSPETYVFLISRVDLGKGVPREVERHVLARLGAAIDQHEDLESKLAAGAPDPDQEPDKFKSYLKSRRLRAFRVNTEVTHFSSQVEPVAGDGPAARRGDQYLTVRVTLRLFGEKVPDRTMAFTGDGSATVKLEIGKTVRESDREEATSAALDQAAREAIAQSLSRLQAPPAQEKKKRRKR
jgi:hypothetical protein